MSIRSVTRLGFAVAALALAGSQAVGQAPASTATAAASAAAPAPIYWRQNLFLIPYQWTSTTDPNSANAVWLYVSKDRGATWQKISEAQPQVRAFNYHAEADGEYWFSIRTLDKQGRSWPDGPMQAELKVIVDTTIPRFGDLTGSLGEGDTLNVHWQVSDANLDATTCKIEAQADANGPWQTVSPPDQTMATSTIYDSRAPYHFPTGAHAVSLRAVAFDRAGNRATYQSTINLNSAPVVTAQPAQWPTLISGRGDGNTTATADAQPKTTPPTPVHLPPIDSPSGWVSAAVTPTTPSVAPSKLPDAPAATQPWPANNAGSTTIPSAVHASQSTESQSVNSAPRHTNAPPSKASTSASAKAASSQFVAFGTPPAAAEAPPLDTSSPFKPLEPFRESSANRQLPVAATISPPVDTVPIPQATTTAQRPANPDPAWSNGIAPKWVSSRTFALEYQLENISDRGVARVELWGTRDNGQTWRSFAVDDDNRSPIQVTVDDEGLYGFRIVVDGAGTPGGQVPRSGDRPDLWVGVDLKRPQVQLTTAAAGKGELAGRVLLRWRAFDDHLDSRPIGLFFSSRPNGPWSTIATNLENSGQYDWQVDRHAPSRIYFRIEARDLAGNVAAYQTPDAVTVEFPMPSGRPEGVTPLGPTAKRPQSGYH